MLCCVGGNVATSLAYHSANVGKTAAGGGEVKGLGQTSHLS